MNYFFSIETFSKHSVAELFETFGSVLESLKGRPEAFIKKVSDNANFAIAKNEGGQVVAFIAFYINQPPLCYITLVATLGQYQHQGLFSKLIKYVEEFSLSNSISNMQLEVKKNNTKTIMAYTNSGFKIERDSNNNYYLMKKMLKNY